MKKQGSPIETEKRTRTGSKKLGEEKTETRKRTEEHHTSPSGTRDDGVHISRTLHLFQQSPLLMRPLKFFQQPLLALSIIVLLFPLHLTQRLSLLTLTILLILLSLNLIQLSSHASMPILMLKMHLYLI